ncbi:hypothetical protein [Altererythrobacter sp. MF3-039]|uniref:hypothetical protein n=1 Tax=Altererythrobacter sp. MF3-039 TaxID=3252901 RepID=UPI00390C81F7
MGKITSLMGAGILLGWSSLAIAQGQDSTRAERDALVIAKLLEGRYDNANQAYFDRRLGDPESERHERIHILVEKDEGGSDLAISVSEGGDSEAENLLVKLSPEPNGRHVRMRFSRAAGSQLAGCDLLFRQEAGQFRATAERKDCNTNGLSLPQEIMLGEHELWWQKRGDDKRPYALERARDFACYIDVPGVGGGRDIPYKRYEIGHIHDKGGKQWIKLADGSEVSVTLTNVRWPINNLKGIFTRHSLVVYVGERKDGEEREIAYSWTQPDAQRVGINLKSMLVNCFMLSNEEIEPFYRQEPQA